MKRVLVRRIGRERATLDTDPDVNDILSLVAGPASIASATRDADGLAITLFTAAVGQSGNSITFDPGTDFNLLAAGETATVVVDYTVTDDDPSPSQTAKNS